MAHRRGRRFSHVVAAHNRRPLISSVNASMANESPASFAGHLIQLPRLIRGVARDTKRGGKNGKALSLKTV
jgi:hypothetical protein